MPDCIDVIKPIPDSEAREEKLRLYRIAVAKKLLRSVAGMRPIEDIDEVAEKLVMAINEDPSLSGLILLNDGLALTSPCPSDNDYGRGFSDGHRKGYLQGTVDQDNFNEANPQWNIGEG